MPHSDDTPTIGDVGRVHSDDKSTIGTAPRAWAPDPSEVFEKPGDVIGPYRLVKRLGEGGFGAVYLAEQSEPVRREVALKIIKVGMDTREVIARFEAERQALALMDHPNVARIIGAGATERGRPYFVMDLVRGEPITTYCDRKNLTMRQRLNLFQQVCDAVQHAHLKGIIHRDIKPSNVLVAEVDGVAIPKVIDFGIAKATDSSDAERTIFTQSGQVIGTPEYMSPEQASGRILDIDTRSDVYALGVLLYELLAGAPPFDSRRLRAAGYAEILRIIREEDPPRPSTRLSSLGASATEIASHRATDVAQLRSSFRGDLDWVVMRALEKDRERRYSTASGLAQDIARYLKNEPIEARPPSRAYKLRKFVRRNKAGVAAGVLVALAILTGSGLAVAGFVQASHQRDLAIAAEGRAVEEAKRASAAEVKAVAEAQTARQISEFLVDMLKGVGPGVALGRDTTLLREIVDKTAGRVEKELGEQPEVSSRLLRIVSAAYNDLAVYDRAEVTAQRSLEIAQSLPGDSRAQVARALFDLAKVQESMGKFADAEATFRRSREVYKETGLGDTADALSALSGIGTVMYRTNRTSEAAPIFREVLEGRLRNANGKDADSLADAMERVAITLPEGDPEALELMRGALEMRRRLYGDEHPEVAVGMTNFAGALFRAGQTEEAITLGREAIEVHRRMYGSEHPHTASALYAQSGLLREAGRMDEAIEMMRLSLETRTKALGRDHRDTLNSVFELGTQLERAGDLTGAEEQYREMVRYGREKYEPGDVRTCAVLMLLANSLSKQGRHDESEPLYREALEGFIARRPAGHRQITQARNALAACLIAQQKFSDAEPLLLAVEEATRAAGVPPAARADALNRLITFYSSWHTAEPDQGHDAKAAQWRTTLDAPAPSPQ